MKQLLSLSAMIVALTANAQIGVFSQVLDKATPVDTARYAVTYTLDYTCHPKADVRFNDVRTLLIGRHNVKDYSDIIHHYDSLATEQSKRGRILSPNPPGSPWQYEIMLSDRGRQADMKYRLPIGIGCCIIQNRFRLCSGNLPLTAHGPFSVLNVKWQPLNLPDENIPRGSQQNCHCHTDHTNSVDFRG